MPTNRFHHRSLVSEIFYKFQLVVSVNMTNIYIMNVISVVDALLKIVLLIRTDGKFKVDTPLKLDNIVFFLKDTY